MGSESEPCVPCGVGIPPLISIIFGNGAIPGIGGSSNLPSWGPNGRVRFSVKRKGQEAMEMKATPIPQSSNAPVLQNIRHPAPNRIGMDVSWPSFSVL